MNQSWGQATSQDTVTTDKPWNKASISYLIQDLLTNLISRLTVGQEGGHPRTVRLGPWRVETLSLSIPRGAGWAVPALGEGSSGVRHSTGTKGRGSWVAVGAGGTAGGFTVRPIATAAISEGDSTSQGPAGSSALLLLQHLHVHAKGLLDGLF